MRIGILGGTFDPIHLGHINPALDVKQQLNLDQVWLMPNHIPPHKNTTMVSSLHRLEMVKLVCEHYPEFQLCDIEINRDTTSYSVTTLTLLTQQYPQYEFFFIMGMDSFIQLPLWYQWQSLFSLCHIALCQRPGWTIDTHSEMAKQLLLRQAYVSDNDQSKHGKIYRIDSQLIDISSTEIRQRLHQHTDTQSVLHPSTRAYIEQHQLYR
ncbi:nicotinate-nucleotide adenylyltransferase [Shewanella basaltis]|uniref:nicotinate-nucleotide adenylyltransferase n=1 Tax=Shewanella basaltis TaxID=472183 RepID=UPI00200E8007|nr:nicotinate-nucleotide adenylyltransferase [Shewanella basaltis]MCL1113830.1 nicotinate-nucleotide adenylyltransferase [Shewanella basaltis]